MSDDVVTDGPRAAAGDPPLWLRLGGRLTRRFGFLNTLNQRWLGIWRPLRHKLSPPYDRYLEAAVGEADSLLEVGCGSASPVAQFTRKPPVRIGVDLHEPSIETSRAAGIHTEYRVLDVRDIGDHFEADSVDVVAAFDVIEHLEEHEGVEMLRAMEKIARRRVVVFTPNGFVEQGEYESNPWQVHRSGWSAQRMRDEGYRVHGVHGLKPFRGEYSNVKWRPRFLWRFVSDLTQPLAYRRPDWAFQILAVKDVG